MSNTCKSRVWLYAKPQGNNKAYCDWCSDYENNEFRCIGGTNRIFGQIFKNYTCQHKITHNRITKVCICSINIYDIH